MQKERADFGPHCPGGNTLDEETIASAAARCDSLFPSSARSATHHLRLAFLLPGILHPEKSPQQIDAERALATLRVNLLGPMLLAKHFAPLLPRKHTQLFAPSAPPDSDAVFPRAAGVMALMSARVGSIGDNRLGGWFSYRASKAGVNQLARTLDNHLRATGGRQAAALALHPGTVRTGLSKEFWGSVPEGKLFEPAWVAERLVRVAAEKAGEEGRGRCFDYDGKVVPP